MPVTATIIVPTQDRAAYLDVALRSLAPQAAAAGAELVVVDDGSRDDTVAVAERHGARVLRHAAPRGLNAARNTGIEHSDGELLCFVDDDVAVRDGWLDALLRAAAELPDEVGVLTGPIRARFEDHRFPTCGREGAPVTELDLGPEDADAPHAWGANMAIRRSALERVGRFDEALPLYGDEQEWQARWRAAGGRIRYVAAAALDHRRAGDDARLRSLCRAAYRRGRASRRFDVVKGAAPPLRHELRVLAGCLAHGPLRRCANGPVLTAHTLGRLREAAGRDAPLPLATPGVDDFLSGASGTVGGVRGRLLRLQDAWQDLRTWPARRAARRAAAAAPRRRVLVLAVVRDDVENLWPAAEAELRRSHHDVEIRTTSPAGRGKFEALNALWATNGAPEWLVVIDDDVTLPRAFLDVLIAQAEEHGLKLAQPAHRRHSHAAWPVTIREGAGTRRTTFVEIGPVTAFHRDTLDVLLPFPDLRMGWGLDAHWSAVAQQRGWPIGVVDAVPVGHTLRAAGASYPRDEAVAEARAFLASRPYVRRGEVRTLR